jgi:hypothetical protein
MGIISGSIWEPTAGASHIILGISGRSCSGSGAILFTGWPVFKMWILICWWLGRGRTRIFGTNSNASILTRTPRLLIWNRTANVEFRNWALLNLNLTFWTLSRLVLYASLQQTSILISGNPSAAAQRVTFEPVAIEWWGPSWGAILRNKHCMPPYT